MRVAIIGAGGVGGYFGARWAAAGHEVTVVARGAHLAAIRSGGLRVTSPLGDLTVDVEAVSADDPNGPQPTASPSSSPDVAEPSSSPGVAEPGGWNARDGDADAVLLATKTWQLPTALRTAAPFVGPRTVVFGAQNGVEAVGEIAAAFGDGRTLGGVCQILSYIDAPGSIKHVGAAPTLILGEPAGGRSERVAALCEALDQEPLARVVASDDIRVDLWRKLLLMAPISSLGAATRAPIGVFRSQPETRALLERAFGEVRDVAEAAGVRLADDIVPRSLAFIDTLPPEGTSSLHRDVEAGRRSELEALAGAVVRIGRAHDVATPVHEMLYAVLLPQERSALEELV